MTILVCCKFVPNLEEMEINSDGSINFDKAEWEVSEFDRQAIQAGVELAKETGAKLVALSVGTSRIKTGQLKKDLLSRGPEELYIVADDKLLGADTGYTAKVLSAAINKIGADLVLFGEGSADNYYKQMGIQVGARLGMLTVNMINAMHWEGNLLIAERVTDEAVTQLEIELPAAVSVTSSINTPPVPNLKAVFSANKKPMTELTLEELGLLNAENSLELVSITAPDNVERKRCVIEGETLDGICDELVRNLKADGVL